MAQGIAIVDSGYGGRADDGEGDQIARQRIKRTIRIPEKRADADDVFPVIGEACRPGLEHDFHGSAGGPEFVRCDDSAFVFADSLERAGLIVDLPLARRGVGVERFGTQGAVVELMFLPLSQKPVSAMTPSNAMKTRLLFAPGGG
jgi:hypothetical protein